MTDNKTDRNKTGRTDVPGTAEKGETTGRVIRKAQKKHRDVRRFPKGLPAVTGLFFLAMLTLFLFITFAGMAKTVGFTYAQF